MLGMILYGYDKDNADKLKVEIGDLLETKIEIFSACGLEDITIENILDKSLSGKFKNKAKKIMVLLGMDNNNIQTILKKFPLDIEKPIFCSITKHNIKWEFSKLMKDLIEEDNYWREQKKSRLKQKK